MQDYASHFLPEMTDMWVEAWAAAMPAIDFEARRRWLVDHLVALDDAGVSIRLLMDAGNGSIAGFVTFDRKTHWLDQLVVSVGHQGRGAAAALLDDVRRRAGGLIRLDVNAQNRRARAFYDRQGFYQVSTGTNPRSGLETVLLEWRESPM